MTITPAPALLRLFLRGGRSLPGMPLPASVATANSSCRARYAHHHRNHHRPAVSGASCRPRGGSLHRTVVTSSTPPSPEVFIERPEVVVLAESSLYGKAGDGDGGSNSWEGHCRSFFPKSGLHFASIDVFRSSSGRCGGGGGGGGNPNDVDVVPSLDALERTMTEDLSRLGDDAVDDIFLGDESSSSAHVVMIARGPVQCLVAQYFLESSPLAGLVLVDPLLLPEDGRATTTGSRKEKGKKTDHLGGGMASSRWRTSLTDLISMLEGGENSPPPPLGASGIDPPLLFPVDDGASLATTQQSSTVGGEIALLRSLLAREEGGGARPLRLEPGSVPILVMYSGMDHAHADRYRICAERTAAFHTCGGRGDHFDQVPVLMVPRGGAAAEAAGGGGNDGKDDVRESMRLIYEWYDEVVA